MTTQMGYNLVASDGTTPKHMVGDEIIVKGATFRYIKAAADIAAFALCVFQNDGDAEEANGTNAATTPIGFCIPQYALSEGEYGWALVGPFLEKHDGTAYKVLAANCSANVVVYTTGTDGVIDDASSSQVKVSGLLLTETVTTQEAADCIAVTRLAANL